MLWCREGIRKRNAAPRMLQMLTRSRCHEHGAPHGHLHGYLSTEQWGCEWCRKHRKLKGCVLPPIHEQLGSSKRFILGDVGCFSARAQMQLRSAIIIIFLSEILRFVEFLWWAHRAEDETQSFFTILTQCHQRVIEPQDHEGWKDP